MLLEIPEGAHIQIIVGSRTSTAGAATLPALLEEAAAVERPAPRSGRAMLEGLFCCDAAGRQCRSR
jgi:hypothetical protein